MPRPESRQPRASRGEQALKVCQLHSGAIHMVITDVVMPQMSRPELAQRLAPLRPETRVLYVSGCTDDAIAHHGVLDPDIAFLEKPFYPEARLKKVLGASEEEVITSSPS